MGIWTPSVPMDAEPIRFETTFADETRGEGRISCGGGPDPPEFIAQVDADVDLRWVPEIRRRTGLIELKYRDVDKWITQDSVMHSMMQETWRRTNIVITDPKPALDNTREWFGSFVESNLLEHPLIHNEMRSFAAYEILSDTPLTRLATLADLAKPGLLLPNEESALPQWGNYQHWITRLGGRYQKVLLFVGRLNASYFELCDDDRFDEAIRRAQTDCGMFGYLVDFGQVLLEFSAAHRVFDRGHESSLKHVELVRNESVKALLQYRGIALPPGYGVIEPRESASSDELQAADLAAGFAKLDYKRCGIAGVLERFRAVVYNGKVIR